MRIRIRIKDRNVPQKRFTVNQSPAKLPESLDRRLNNYALAAGAAGVALLACAAPAAEAAPVCKTVSVPLFRSATYPFNPAGQSIAPFNIGQSSVLFTGSGYSSSFVDWNRAFFAPNSLGAQVSVDSKGLPADLASGAQIGPGGDFGKGNSYGLMFTYGKGPGPNSGAGTISRHQGNFNFQQKNLFGFQFAQAGKIYYGWARLQASIQKYQGYQRTRIALLGYGYESSPNTAISAGSCTDAPNGTSSARLVTTPSGSAAESVPSGAALGMLALGNSGLPLWRK
jgi:hypothetical protein